MLHLWVHAAACMTMKDIRISREQNYSLENIDMGRKLEFIPFSFCFPLM